MINLLPLATIISTWTLFLKLSNKKKSTACFLGALDLLYLGVTIENTCRRHYRAPSHHYQYMDTIYKTGHFRRYGENDIQRSFGCHSQHTCKNVRILLN